MLFIQTMLMSSLVVSVLLAAYHLVMLVADAYFDRPDFARDRRQWSFEAAVLLYLIPTAIITAFSIMLGVIASIGGQ